MKRLILITAFIAIGLLPLGYGLLATFKEIPSAVVTVASVDYDKLSTVQSADEAKEKARLEELLRSMERSVDMLEPSAPIPSEPINTPPPLLAERTETEGNSVFTYESSTMRIHLELKDILTALGTLNSLVLGWFVFLRRKPEIVMVKQYD